MKQMKVKRSLYLHKMNRLYTAFGRFQINYVHTTASLDHHSSLPPTPLSTRPLLLAVKFWSRWNRPGPNFSYTLTRPPPENNCSSTGSRVNEKVSLLQFTLRCSTSIATVVPSEANS